MTAGGSSETVSVTGDGSSGTVSVTGDGSSGTVSVTGDGSSGTVSMTGDGSSGTVSVTVILRPYYCNRGTENCNRVTVAEGLCDYTVRWQQRDCTLLMMPGGIFVVSTPVGPQHRYA